MIIFHKIFNDIYCIKLPPYFRTFDESDRARLRSTVRAPVYYNSERDTLDLASMRAVSQDDKSLKCTLASVSPCLKRSFYYRVHMLWNHLPINIREEQAPSKFKALLIAHLWDVVMKPD